MPTGVCYGSGMTYKKGSASKPRLHGHKWLRNERRLALYMRDSGLCVYCRKGPKQGAVLSLDHIIPWSQGGTNESSNLVTACRDCNRERMTVPVEQFASKAAQKRIRKQVRLRVETWRATALIREHATLSGATAQLFNA